MPKSAQETMNERPRRGVGRGGKFFAVGRETWERLWSVETGNRLNLVTAYLVLAAGTGSDHRLTKWSAKACEEHVGMGKPRAKKAIEELVHGGLVERTASSTAMMPQYRLPELPRDADPIFLPVQLITGFSGETPVLRRVRETGDALLLRMLCDLYGLVQTDAAYGVPIANLRQGARDEAISRKLFERGANAVWALVYGSGRAAFGVWASYHHEPGKGTANEDWSAFWDRVKSLQLIGALEYEPWVFDGLALDAEPLFPVTLDEANELLAEDPVSALTITALTTSQLLAGDRAWVQQGQSADMLVVFPAHHQPPALRGVAKLRIEADTPGRRRSYALRMAAIEHYTSAYQALRENAAQGRHDRTLGSPTKLEKD
jgi:hypothetical protein